MALSFHRIVLVGAVTSIVACASAPPVPPGEHHYKPTAKDCANAPAYEPPAAGVAADPIDVWFQLGPLARYKTLAVCVLLDGKGILVERDTTGALFASGTSLEQTLRVARGEHAIQTMIWMAGAGPLDGRKFEVASSRRFELGAPGEGRLRISLAEEYPNMPPGEGLSIRWLGEGSVRDLDPKTDPPDRGAAPPSAPR
jgi:hypothetical protein